MGGDRLADGAVSRDSPEVFGPMASDPTISRLIHVPAETGPKAPRRIRVARAVAREHMWKAAGQAAPGAGDALVLLKGNAGPDSAEDHITAERLALTQIPARLHKQVPIRTDSGGDTHPIRFAHCRISPA